MEEREFQVCDDMKSGLEIRVGAMYIYPVVYTSISANRGIFEAEITVHVLHVCHILSPHTYTCQTAQASATQATSKRSLCLYRVEPA